ncbi:MAG: hypothetical protein JW709_13870, partial [Sedimentisphaerales bacterium]|nr:hypothetical protein [Sedimentisphaerales bacterium]
MKKVLLVLLSSILSCATAKAVLIGYDGFSYANGPLEGNNGGEGWAWQNSTQTQNNIGGVSAWIKYGTGDTLITGGKFYSSDNGSLRDYGADRADAALMNGEGKVYYSIEVTPTGAEEKWFGISSMDQSTERIKFGRVRDSDTNWGIQSRIGSSSWTYNISEISIVMNETVRLVCAIDLDNDMLKLWVNPDENDYDNGADNTADAVRTDFTS